MAEQTYNQRYADGDSNTAGAFGFDQISTVDYAISKVAFGDANTITRVTASAGLPVSLLAGSASIGVLGANSGVDIGDVTINNASGASAVNIQDGGNSITVDGTVAITGSVTVDLGANNDVTLATLPDTSAGDLAAINSALAGTLTVGLPTGAATAAKQPALGTAGTASSDVITVQGIASMTALKVDGSAVTQPVSGTFWQTTQPVSLTSTTITGTVAVTQSGTWDEVGINDSGNSITVDAPVGTPVFVRLSDGSSAITTLPVSLASVPSHAVTNAGTFAVQSTLQAGTAYAGKVRLTDGTTDAEVVPLTGYNAQAVAIVDASGDQITSFGGGTQYTEGDTDASITGTACMWEDTSNTLVAASAAKPFPVEIVAGAGSGGTAAADDADFTAGTTSGTPVMGVYESSPTSVTDGDMGVVGITSTRLLKVTGAGGSFPITDSGGSITIDTNSGAISVDGAGATFPITDNGGSITIDTALGAIAVDGSGVTQPVSGTFWQATQPVSLASVPSHAVTNAGTFAVQVTSGGGGTEYTEDVATANPIVGTATMMERDDALATLTPIEGDWAGMRCTAEGALWVQDFNSDAIATSVSNIDVNTGSTATYAGNIDLSTTDLPNVIGTDGSAGPTKALSVAGTESGGTLQELRVDADGHLQVDVLSNVISSGTLTTVSTVTTCSTVTTLTGGGVAHDGADSGNPHKIGAKATTALSGLTLVANADRTDLFAGVDGVQIVRTHCNLEDVVQERATNTDGASTAFSSGLAAPGSGVRLWITGVTISNSSSSFCTVDLRDGSAGSVLWTFPVPATGGVTHKFDPPLKLTANTALAFDASAATTTLTISANGFKSKV